MNSDFLYAEKVSLENILKLFFKQSLPEDELQKYHFIKNSLVTHFKITDSIGEFNFKDYFVTDNSNENIFTFFSSNIDKIIFAFKYNQEIQKFSLGISFDNTLISNEQIFEKLSLELVNPNLSPIFIENNKISGANHEFIRLLYWLRSIASKEYEKNVIFFPELITIQNLIIEGYGLLSQK